MKLIIKIQKPGNVQLLKLDSQTSQSLYNSAPVNINQSYYLNKLVSIISTFDKNPKPTLSFGGESYQIELQDGDKLTKIYGTSPFPERYADLVALVNEIAKYKSEV